MTERSPVVIVGAGHNGLVCATYLARAGRKVLMLEAAERVGGAAITREFAPGYQAPAVAHLLHLLDPAIARDLSLTRHGLDYAHAALGTVALSVQGAPLSINGCEIQGSGVSAADQAAFAQYAARMQKFSQFIARQHGRVPPRLAFNGWRDALPAAAVGLDLRRLGQRDMREFLRVVTMNIYDVLEDTFENPLLKGALALDGVLGARLGPRSGNTVYNALYRNSGTVNGQRGAFAMPRGGMGAVTQALAAAARAAGVEIRCSSPVTEILVGKGRVAGVRLDGGAEIAAACVISNADPQTTLLKLLGARHLETEFARRIQHLRNAGNAAKLHLALSGLPQIHGLAPERLGDRLLIAPELEYIERAFNPAKYGEFSPQPVLEVTVPSIHDPTLAPTGGHVLSAVVQYAPYQLNGGWEAGKPRLYAAAMAVLEQYAPGIGRLVTHSELLTPADIEQQFRIAGGHWHHAELALDQFMMLRPVPGAAQYAMPVEGLYLCGAGCHPGGGVMGSAGRNAARVVLGRR